MILRSCVFLLLFSTSVVFSKRIDLQNRGGDESEEEELDEQLTDKKSKSMYEFLYKRMNQEVVPKKRLSPNIYTIPGPQEPLPGRSHQGDYWPVFPFQNQYSGGLDLDPSISRHIGGDFNLAIPSWGVLDIYGRFYNRIHDTTTKFGYVNHPVNMLDLEKEDFVKLMSDPAMQANRNAHPTLPLGKFGKTYVPLNCKPPLCNPYQMNFGLGIEHDWGGSDGVEGDIDVPMPISKGIAYRMPFSGNVYYNRDNVTVTYGQNLGPIEPFSSLFDYQKYRDPVTRNLVPRRWPRSVAEHSMPSQHPFDQDLSPGIPRRWTRSIREPVDLQMPMMQRNMLPRGDMSLYPYPSVAPSVLFRPSPSMFPHPYFHSKQFYQPFFPSQFVRGPIRRRRKYRIIPNYHYVYF